MNRQYMLIFILLILAATSQAQTLISGYIKNKSKEPLAGASITLENTYSGATSSGNGYFSFTVSDTGRQQLIISAMGYKKFEAELSLSSLPLSFNVTLKEEVTEMQAVIVAAGSFEASDKKRNTVLKPLDILTTAGQQADIVAALKTLPGAQQVGETEGLFVRGGTGSETKVFIDGMMVTNPFYSSVPDIAQRGRFSPLLFKGTHFSSGGYSSQYGQALSSALTLETHDLPSRSETNMIISSPQLTLTRYQLNKTKTASAGITINYNNLQPYFSIVPQKINYSKAPEVINGELYGRLKTKTGMLKYYGYANYNHLGFDKKSIEGKNWQDHFTLFNNHAFSLLTYTGTIKDSWKLSTGAGFSYNKDKISIHSLLHGDTINYFLPRITNYTTQARAVATKNLQGLNKINIGAEYQLVTDKINAMDSIPFITRQDHYASLFTETDLYIGAKFVTRLGMRFEHSSLLNDTKFSPRLSLAYKLGGHGQVSAAYGDFYQKPDVNLLFRYPNLKFTKATHYLLNYQRMANGQTIRLELFHKEYKQLVTFNAGNSFDLRNEGSGYSRGIELFWRDKKTFKNFSYWIAYSFLDTKRQFLDYPVKVQPSFAAKHTANLVMKQWVEKIAAMFSLTYTYASGRPYYNPNLSKEDFMKDRTIAYHNMGLQVNYLTTIGKANAVLIFNTNNVLGSDQVYSYRFAANKNIAGSYNGEAVTPMARRFYFIGIYLSMGSDRRKEIIDN